MKLLTNKHYNSIFTYFPGIDFPNAWTLENPAVFHYVKDNNYNRVLLSKFTLMSDVKYLLFKAERNINYAISAQSFNSNYYYYNNNLKVSFYDFLSFSKSDVEKDKNAIKNFVIKSNYDNYFSFTYPTYILMKITPNNEDALSKHNSTEKRYYLYFNNNLLQFDCNSHFIRDWTKKIDGTTWNVNGKLNSSNSLYYLNKNVGRSYIY